MNDIDAPLVAVKDDQLGRDVYAQRVADMIGSRRGEHSAVFAIYGEWGSGKTSFKNFVLEKLKTLPRPKRPLVIEFNPWEWEGPKQVVEAFFARIIEEIGEKAPNGEEVSERLGRYASYFTLGASIAESASAILPLFVPGVGPLATLMGKALKEAGKQTRVGAEAKPKQESLSDLRRNLIDSIKAMDKTLIVTIDDVDRLTTNETAILFQLLKSNADFPNIVYLILCDREVVARNLGKVVAERGDKYLDKIVQQGLPLPKAYPEKLRAFLLDRIQQIVRKAGIERFLNVHRMYRLYDHHAESYFRTMRDVNRFLATFETLLPALVNDQEPEVDLVDFLGIEFLRSFDPSLYEKIYFHRARVTGREAVLSKDQEAFINELAGKRGQDRPAMGIFRALFPRFGSGNTAEVTARSIAHPRAFDRYFLFAIPPDQYGGAEERDILARRGRPEFVTELETARSRGRLQYLLETLNRADLPSSIEDAISYIAGLAKLADSLPIDEGADGEAYRGQIERLIFSCLRPLDVAVRTDVMLQVYERSTSLSFAVRFAEHFKSKEPAELMPDATDRLVDMAKARLALAGDEIMKHPALGELLIWWSENGGAVQATEIARQMLNTDDQLFDLLRTFSQVNLTNVGKFRKSRNGFKSFTRELHRFVPITAVLRRLDDLDETTFSWEKREVVRTVRDDARRAAETDAVVASEKSGDAP